uniref:Uncharacterized protein n=1 Tax=Cacopsylla melanoneura TaxID=428564 RepID=A0A8D8LM82_9HEMI
MRFFFFKCNKYNPVSKRNSIFIYKRVDTYIFYSVCTQKRTYFQIIHDMPNFSNMYTGEQPFRDDFSSVFLRKTQDADLSGPYVFFGPSALKKLLTLGTGFTREGYSRSLEQSDKLVSQYRHVFSWFF